MSFELGLKILLALYVVVALAMIGLILLQRGSGAQAGSGFGGGASATVFGSRGSANFLSSSTKWLAVLFFALSIGMGDCRCSGRSRRDGRRPNARRGCQAGRRAGSRER